MNFRLIVELCAICGVPRLLALEHDLRRSIVWPRPSNTRSWKERFQGGDGQVDATIRAWRAAIADALAVRLSSPGPNPGRLVPWP